MRLQEIVSVLRAHWWPLVIGLAAGAIGMGALSMSATPVYRASASLYFSMAVGQSATDLNQGQTYTQSQMVSFAQLAVLPVTLEPVIEELGLATTPGELAREVSVLIPQNSVLLQINATSTSPQEAADVANAVAGQLIEVVDDVSPRNSKGGAPNVRARVVKQAVAPAFAFSPNTTRNIAAGAAGGLLLGIIVAYLRHALDTRVRRPADATVALGAPVIATLGRAPGRGTDGHVLAPSATGLLAEDFRRLRTNLQHLAVVGEPLSLVVSSTLRGEGKSTTCANVAAAFAEADYRVLLIDADLRQPSLAEMLGVPREPGLSSVLGGKVLIGDAMRRWRPRIDIIPAGDVPANPGELLASRAMANLIAQVRGRYDVVLIDTPPVPDAADAITLSRLVTGVVLVADTRRARHSQLSAAGESVRAAGGTVLGVVLTMADQRHEFAGTDAALSVEVGLPAARGA